MSKDMSKTQYYRSRIKDLSDQVGILTDMELSRALAEIAFEIHAEAAIIRMQALEYGRVK